MQAMNEHWEFWHVSNISRDLERDSIRVIFLPIAAAAAMSLQSCLTLCDSIDGSPPGSPSLGFSRQEHWSGLPFPSPMQESEKWKGIRSVVSDSSRLHGLQPTRLLHPWDFPARVLEWGAIAFSTQLVHVHLFQLSTAFEPYFSTTKDPWTWKEWIPDPFVHKPGELTLCLLEQNQLLEITNNSALESMFEMTSNLHMF